MYVHVEYDVPLWLPHSLETAGRPCENADIMLLCVGSLRGISEYAGIVDENVKSAEAVERSTNYRITLFNRIVVWYCL